MIYKITDYKTGASILNSDYEKNPLTPASLLSDNNSVENFKKEKINLIENLNLKFSLIFHNKLNPLLTLQQLMENISYLLAKYQVLKDHCQYF